MWRSPVRASDFNQLGGLGKSINVGKLIDGKAHNAEL
jgi:hypothetical protein